MSKHTKATLILLALAATAALPALPTTPASASPPEGPGVADATGMAGVLAQGRSIHYSVGFFERIVIPNRLNRASKHYTPGFHLRGGVDGYTSYTYPNCSKLGHIAVARLYDPKTKSWSPTLRLLIADCPHSYDYAALKGRGVVLEVDGSTAVRYHFYWNPKTNKGIGSTRATVLRIDP